jgi:peptidoglycan/LPS O-acetylase OafA/YrhL
MQKKFDQIDSLRFFAVFAVVCGHWEWFGNQLMDFSAFTARGVDLFFVISGFLISLGLIRSKNKEQSISTSLWKFYIRRFLRIFPIYYLTVFIVYIFWHKQMTGSIWWYLLYLVNFHCIKTQAWGVGGQFWSLSVEEQFYFVWPFIMLFVPLKKLPLVIISAVFISLAAKTYWAIQGAPFWAPYMHPLGSLDALALGALLAYLYHYYPDTLKSFLNNRYVISLLIVQLAIVIGIGYLPACISLYNVLIRASFGLFGMWLIGRSTFGFKGAMGYILNSRSLQYIGKISYGIYLFHDFVPGMLMGLQFPQNANLRFLMYGVITIGLASLSWYLFESKILKLKDRFE